MQTSPTELTLIIFDYCGDEMRPALLLVCKRWREAISSNYRTPLTTVSRIIMAYGRDYYLRAFPYSTGPAISAYNEIANGGKVNDYPPEVAARVATENPVEDILRSVAYSFLREEICEHLYMSRRISDLDRIISSSGLSVGTMRGFIRMRDWKSPEMFTLVTDKEFIDCSIDVADMELIYNTEKNYNLLAAVIWYSERFTCDCSSDDYWGDIESMFATFAAVSITNGDREHYFQLKAHHMANYRGTAEQAYAAFARDQMAYLNHEEPPRAADLGFYEDNMPGRPVAVYFHYILDQSRADIPTFLFRLVAPDPDVIEHLERSIITPSVISCLAGQGNLACLKMFAKSDTPVARAITAAVVKTRGAFYLQ